MSDLKAQLEALCRDHVPFGGRTVVRPKQGAVPRFKPDVPYEINYLGSFTKVEHTGIRSSATSFTPPELFICCRFTPQNMTIDEVRGCLIDMEKSLIQTLDPKLGTHLLLWHRGYELNALNENWLVSAMVAVANVVAGWGTIS